MEIKLIDREHAADINIKNEPFGLWGRMIPTYDGSKWDYTVEKFPESEIGETCFPDENYDYDEMSRDCLFLGAYDGEKCVGLAVLREGFLKYIYLHDLKVNRDYRGRGVGKMLIGGMLELAAKKGYRGVYAIGQDNNLSACLFYVRNGFRIGGLDTEVYRGTSQEGKKDVIFYAEAFENSAPTADREQI